VVYECVINVSQGRDEKLLDELATKFKSCLLDIHRDHDHHRSVLTFAHKQLEPLAKTIREFSSFALMHSTYKDHQGVHPNYGFIDVVPFVSYDENSRFPNSETIQAARDYGVWINETYDIAVSFYDHASPEKTSLPQLRKNLKSDLTKSDILSIKQSAEHGVICVGARQPLIAINVNLFSDDINVAKKIASDVRESSGGIKNVRALSFTLDSQNKTQVSMNIIDAQETNAGEVALKVREHARSHNIESDVELVGLVPSFQFEKWSEEFLLWSQLDADITVENRLKEGAI